MNTFCWANCLCIVFLALGVNSESYYTINAPGVIKSNRKYSIVAALHEATEPCSIRVMIEGPNYKDFKDVNLQPFEFQVVEFFPKRLEEGSYYLKAEGLSGLDFKNESIVQEIVYEGPKIYIQTNKAVYKPQDLVFFRFLMLDEHMRPLSIESPIRVEILDADNNLYKHFQNISLTQGIFTDHFQLLKYPALGTWTINVAIDGTYGYSKSKTIRVLNYVQPKFRMYLEAPSEILLDDGYIKLAMYGKYTFDKHVEGNATVELWNGDRNLLLLSQQLEILNFRFVHLNLKPVKDIAKYNDVYVKAYLTEKYTGTTEHEEHLITLRRHGYDIIVLYDEIEFENNKPNSIKIYVKHWTGAPVLNSKALVTMKHGDKVYETILDRTGAATFVFDYVPDADYDFQFRDSRQMLPALVLKNLEYYCRLKLLDEKIKLGKPVQIEVTSILNIPYLMYIMMGHSSVIRTEYIKVPPNQKSHIISITPTIEMIPRSFIYVFYVQNGNLRYEEITLNFPEQFENQISLSAPQQVKPGENVTITVNAQQKSYVGLMAVDLGDYLLDKSYDLDRHKIMEELVEEHSYSPIDSAEYPGIISGLITLTNSHFPYRALAAPTKAKSDIPTVDRFRQTFSENWIFDNYLMRTSEVSNLAAGVNDGSKSVTSINQESSMAANILNSGRTKRSKRASRFSTAIYANDAQTKLTFQIPNDITTWRITAFSINAVTGFGIVDKAIDIATMQTFFISLNLPYAVKRGEIATIPAIVFNYSNQTLDTEVILQNPEKEFYFMESERNYLKKSADEQQQKKRIVIAPNKGYTVKFVIVPIKSGKINIGAVANSASYSDAVLQKLIVEPEGVPIQQNQELHLSIPEGEKISYTLEITDPVESVPDSEYVTFSVGGHYLVPTVDDFQKLTKMTSVTSEQNMINFALSVLVLQYLKINGKLSKEKGLVESLQSAIEVGYQTQLNYRHENVGGYSVFGMSTDEEPSSWITAYVVRYFIKASEFIDIKADTIETDLQYLASQQTEEGEFLCTGCLFHQKREDKYGLTAFILLTFLENQEIANRYQKVIKNGTRFLRSNLNNIEGTRQLALVATAIKRSKQRGAEVLIDKLNKLSKQKKGLRWWSSEDRNSSSDVEVTANAALTVLETPGDHIPILKWLIKQRNGNDSSMASYDTVAGMEALLEFSEKYSNIDNMNLKVSYSAKDEQGNQIETEDFHVDSKNVLHFQKHELPRGVRQVTFVLEGKGATLVQLTQHYNVDTGQKYRYFNIEAKTAMKTKDDYILELCFTYLPDTGIPNDTTNRVIAEVILPSGFRSEPENSLPLINNRLVRKVETKDSDSVVFLYLNKLIADTKYCLQMPLDKVSEVLMPKPAVVVIYDSFNRTRSSAQLYSI